MIEHKPPGYQPWRDEDPIAHANVRAIATIFGAIFGGGLVCGVIAVSIFALTRPAPEVIQITAAPPLEVLASDDATPDDMLIAEATTEAESTEEATEEATPTEAFSIISSTGAAPPTWTPYPTYTPYPTLTAVPPIIHTQIVEVAGQNVRATVIVDRVRDVYIEVEVTRIVRDVIVVTAPPIPTTIPPTLPPLPTATMPPLPTLTSTPTTTATATETPSATPTDLPTITPEATEHAD